MGEEYREVRGSTLADSVVRLSADRLALVELDPNHPGFRDAAYRARRNQIAQIALDHTPGEPVPDAPYSDEEHRVWSWICEGLRPMHQKYACRDFLEAWDNIALPTDRIPQLREVSLVIEKMTGFRFAPVAGLIESKPFISSLYDGVFLATQYIRHHSTPSYTPEPDVVHELAGHAAQLATPKFAKLNRRFGEVARSLHDEDALLRLGRVYWFTIEFGLLKEEGLVKAYGAGLLSSFGELEHLEKAHIEPFDLGVIEAQDYDVTQFQNPLFCAESVDHVIEELGAYLA